jgi:Fic family protein
MAERNTVAKQIELVTAPAEKARREAENKHKLAAVTVEIIRPLVQNKERPFRFRQGILMQLHASALQGIHLLSGTFRNCPANIHGSNHEPPPAFQVAEEVADLCAHVNTEWHRQSALYLSSYVMWRINWIQPFAAGNGRTSRAASYVVLNMKLDGLLPGTPTIPDLIDTEKTAYYEALEAADAAWKERSVVDVSGLEQMIREMLAKQLLNAAKQAESDRGEQIAMAA